MRQPERYSLLMALNVKNTKRKGTRTPDQSRVSSKHQITIPTGAFREAGLREGDVVAVKAQGPGRVLVARIEDFVAEYAGCLRTGGELGRTVRNLRDEWR